jgi:hypothetical protein
MDDLETVLMEHPERLLAVLSCRLMADGATSPVVDAVHSLEAAARRRRVNVGAVSGMPWVSYRSYAVGLHAVLGRLLSIASSAEHAVVQRCAREIEHLALNAGGMVESAVANWIDVEAVRHGTRSEVLNLDAEWVRAELLDALWEASGELQVLATRRY